MIALTRDLHVFASRVTTGFTAILLSIRHIAHARYVRALLAFLICHFEFDPFESAHPLRPRALTLDVVPLPHRPVGLPGESADRSAFGDYVISGDCMQVSKTPVLLTYSFRGCWVSCPKKRSGLRVRGLIACQYLDGLEIVPLLIEVRFQLNLETRYF
jgi:hypothetical protein